MTTLQIQRMTAAELDMAIDELEKRSYTLLKRGTSDYVLNQTKYRPSSLRPYKHAGTVTHKKHWAVLRREV